MPLCSHLRQVLAVHPSVRLGPPDLARVALHLEVLVALGAAETERLRTEHTRGQTPPHNVYKHRAGNTSSISGNETLVFSVTLLPEGVLLIEAVMEAYSITNSAIVIHLEALGA